MASVAIRVAAARIWLAEQCMLADTEWLTGCVEYLCNDGEVRTQQEINELAREQWLLNDLKDVCKGSLPPGLHTQNCTLLPGRYILQVNCTLDVGTPAYQQYQKLKKINTENIEETTRHEDKIPNHRMIKLYLTDGVQEIFGLEYRTMRNLTCDIVPGCKMLLKGPVVCRRGMLLLQEQNLEILGGEVEDLATENNLAAVLTRLLSVQDIGTVDRSQHTPAIQNIPPPIAQQPTAQIMSSNITIANPNEPLNNRLQNASTAHPYMGYMGPSFNRLHSNQNEQPTAFSTARPVARVTGVPVADNISDDDIDLDEIAAIEEQINKQASNKRPLWHDSKSERTDSNSVKKLKMQNAQKGNRDDEFPTDEDLMENDMDCFEDIEMTELLLNAKPSTSRKDHSYNNPTVPVSYPINVPAEPFIYIKQIKDMTEKDRMGKVFRIKGQIMKLLSKLSLGKEGWSLKVTLIDGTGSLDVDFTSDVLAKLVGISASEMTKMKKVMREKAEVRERANEALNAAKHNLQVLNCIIEITYLDSPKVTELIPFTDVHAKMLMDRLVATNL